MITKTALALRKMADGLQKQIDHARRPMTQNPTPKRMREYRSRLHDGGNIERVQRAMRALADAHDAGTIAPSLAAIRSRDEIHRLVYRGLSGQGGYYDVIPAAQEYANSTAEAIALQSLMANAPEAPTDAETQEKRRREEIGKLEADVQFRPLPGYFPTPAALADELVALAEIEPGHCILEPSAGKGNIVDALYRANPDARIDTIERQQSLCAILQLKGYAPIADDFLSCDIGQYDRIVMNPPFEDNADIEHVTRAYSVLAPGGRIVSIMGEGVFFRQQRKAAEFREWLDRLGATATQLPQGSFVSSERPTGVSTRVVIIDKPQEAAFQLS